MSKRTYITLSCIFACIAGVSYLFGNMKNVQYYFLGAIWFATIANNEEIR